MMIIFSVRIRVVENRFRVLLSVLFLVVRLMVDFVMIVSLRNVVMKVNFVCGFDVWWMCWCLVVLVVKMVVLV